MPAPETELDPDSFWSAVAARSRQATECGALQPISTRASYIEHEGIEFVVRVSDNLARKRSAPSAYHRPSDPDPFRHPDPELTVGTLPPEHLAVLNKFNVIERHVLVITREFAHQETPLTAADFAAVAVGLRRGDGLAFYNAGRTAGASQPHKHFQLVPLPLGRGGDMPMSECFHGAASGVNTVRGLRFQHALYRLDVGPGDTAAFGRACHRLYERALRELSLDTEADQSEARHLPPYNLLLTDRWLFLVPRRTEHFQDISVNALGYAGSLFVASPGKLDEVRRAGPMRILEQVSRPPR